MTKATYKRALNWLTTSEYLSSWHRNDETAESSHLNP